MQHKTILFMIHYIELVCLIICIKNKTKKKIFFTPIQQIAELFVDVLICRNNLSTDGRRGFFSSPAVAHDCIFEPLSFKRNDKKNNKYIMNNDNKLRGENKITSNRYVHLKPSPHPVRPQTDRHGYSIIYVGAEKQKGVRG